MRGYFKRIVSFFLVPLTRWYLRTDRHYKYEGISIKVLTGVFHPGLFPSTRFLISYLEKQSLASQSLLELGCGTGLISIVAAQMGAQVTASDLNPKAVENCKLNAASNKVPVEVFHSDLFDSLPPQTFDWIVINPPYYPKNAQTDEELAWNCGEGFEYFIKLFAGLKDFIHPNSHVLMVLTQVLDINRIQLIAGNNQFSMQLLQEQNVLFDGKDLLFKIVSTQ